MINKDECTGCGACYSICARKAITMTPDLGGFLHPVIDEKKCVHCGLCDKVCEQANTRCENKFKDLIALKHQDENIIKSSTSGGAFLLFANYIIETGGVVYGAAYNDDYSVVHTRCDNKSDLVKLQKSKYVQSDTHSVYEMIASDIRAGKSVLYSGTACQCSGVLAFAERKKLDLEKLLTCDVICHGVPSPQIWQEYLNYRSQHHGKIVSADFRCKKKSWRDFRMSLTFDSGKTKTYRQNEDYFMILFFHDYILRKSCYSCKFTSTKRKADITLGDFWGLEEFFPDFNDDKGTSVVMLNTDKGEDLFYTVKSNCNFIHVNESQLTLRQPNLRRPSHKSPRYEQFWSDYKTKGFDYCLKTYADNTMLGRLKRQYIFKALYYAGIFGLLLKIKNRK